MISISLPRHPYKSLRRFYTQLTSAEFFHGSMSAVINPGRILACMAVYCLFFLFLYIRNVNIIRGPENHSLFTGAYFEEIQIKFAVGPDPALNRQQAGNLM